ncbi:MAG: hypothetical protein KGR22_11575, partial [Planctomycetes bacterium]|nr:hypothetical protein [Planctomycetota bacterium]
MAQEAPVLLRDERHQVALDLHGIIVPGQPEALGEPPDVRVDDHALVDREAVAEHHVGGLAR